MTTARAVGGRFQIVAGRTVHRHSESTTITRVRGAMTQIESFSSGDPFGDSTAVMTFPAITPFDDLDSPEFSPWLGYYSNIDIYWVPAIPADTPGYDANITVINAITGLPDVKVPLYTRDALGNITGRNRIKVWEGFLSSMDWTIENNSASLQVQCQGALFQADRYLQKPFYPAQPWPLELLIADVFDHKRRPHLRTRPLVTVFPSGWKLVVPKYTGNTVFTPVAKPGSKWSGYSSRQTGSWDHSLTGFVQNLLTEMITDDRSGVTQGNQWTVSHRRESNLHPTGRLPVLEVRDRFRPADFSFWIGTPGIKVRLTGDSTQSENIIYGDGTDIDGTTWRGAVISNDGSRTDYLPLAASRDVYPERKGRVPIAGAFVSEAYTRYGPGVSEEQGRRSAAQTLNRDQQPGYSGTIEFAVDPALNFPRWIIAAGMTVKAKGLFGTGEDGINLHISAVEAAPQAGTVTCTVDQRYRDLLTVEEAQARTRDPLTPVKMLQVNRTSVLIDDIQAPWDYSAGSGYVTKASKAFYHSKPSRDVFPYVNWREQHPPLQYPSWYVKCNAGAPRRKDRWAGPIPILTSEKDTVTRTEFAACDVFGRPLAVPFHVSLYYTHIAVDQMPEDAQGPSPYIDGAFESVNPATGQPWPSGNFLAPDPAMIVGWGNRSGGVYNRAGFWPSSETAGARPSGLFVDDGPWSFDNTSNPDYDKLLAPGKREPASAITIYAMFYCEHPRPVYFLGRLFRQNPGVS